LTSVIYAADKGHVDIVAYLLGRPSIDVDARTARGNRALNLACQKGHLAVVKLLVAAGTRVEWQAGDRLGPLVDAALGGQLQVVKYLVEEAGADVGCTNRDGVTPLIEAAGKGHMDIVSYLLGRPGIDIEAMTAKGTRALNLACYNGHLEVAKLLVAAGARVDPPALHERAALSDAALGGHLQVVKYLVEECGADVGRAEFNGKTPLVTALKKGHVDIVEFLRGIVSREEEVRVLGQTYPITVI
jgi:ankyrin repeat protein